MLTLKMRYLTNVCFARDISQNNEAITLKKAFNILFLHISIRPTSASNVKAPQNLKKNFDS